MSGVNKVILIGNLGQDPEVRQTQSGTSVVNLRLAVPEKRRNQDGEYVDHVEWISVAAFGKIAENAEKYLQKGAKVYVEGKYQSKKYTDKTGTEKIVTEVLASNLVYVSRRQED